MLERNLKAAEQRRVRDVRDFAAARDAAAGSAALSGGADDFGMEDSARLVRALRRPRFLSHLVQKVPAVIRSAPAADTAPQTHRACQGSAMSALEAV